MSAVVQFPPFNVRTMMADDLDEVMRIELAEYPYPWTRKIFADCLRVGYHCFVGEVDGLFAGYGVMSTGVGEAHILNVCVSRDFQRRGLGHILLETMLTMAAELKVETVFLEVRPSNEGAQKLYQQFGFNEIAIRKNYYPTGKGREDALILALELSPGN